ncbi:Uncharacterised protein [Mycobacterium tuberculosis]|nr:Uncharacterised protein [Mycobacterium tuberculosis]
MAIGVATLVMSLILKPRPLVAAGPAPQLTHQP